MSPHSHHINLTLLLHQRTCPPDNVALQQYMHMIQIQITPNGGATLRLVGHEPPNIYIYINI